MAEGSGTGKDKSDAGDSDGWSINRLRRRPRKSTHAVVSQLLVPKVATEKKRPSCLLKNNGNTSSMGLNNRNLRNYPDFRYSTEKPRDPEANSRNRFETDAPHYPDVIFIPLPFHEAIGQLVQPTTLHNGSLDNSCSFYLTPSQAAMIQKGRKGAVDLFNPSDKYSVQVLLRIGLLEITSAQHDCYPPALMVYVNRCLIPIPPHTVSSTEPKKYSPIDVTPYLQIDPFAANVIKIISSPAFQRFVTAVYLVKKHSWNVLLNRLRSKALRVAYYTKAMIRQKLKDDAENDILTTSLRVSLVCPLGKMRMGTPCRPTTCDHIQCFDASIFLQMNEKKATWQCPVCNKTACYDSLTIDEYFQNVVTSTSLPSSCAEIEVMADGGWRPMGSAQAVQPASTVRNESSVNLDSSDGEIEVIRCEAKETPRKPARRSRTPVPDYVDLVSSPSPPASPESPTKLLPFKKRRTNQSNNERQNVPLMTVIDLDSSSDVDDEEVKACSSTASTSSSDSDIIQAGPSRRQRIRCIANSSDSEASLGGPLNCIKKPLDDGPHLNDNDGQLAHISPKYNSNENFDSSRINSISYSINKAKSSATSIVIQKATNPSSQTSEDKIMDDGNQSVEALPDSSSKTDALPSCLDFLPSEQQIKAVSDFFLSAARNNSQHLMGVLDQIAEDLSSHDRHSNYFADTNPGSSYSTTANNDSSVICLEPSLFENGTMNSGIDTLMLAIAEAEQMKPPEPGPSTSKSKADENNSSNSVQICDVVSSTDVEISDDHNYVHREVTIQPEVVIECQGSIVTSTNDYQIQGEKLDQVGEQSSFKDDARSSKRRKKNRNERSTSQREELPPRPEITVPSTIESYVSVSLKHVESSCSSQKSPEDLSPDSPTPEDLSPDSPTPEDLSPDRPTPEDLSPDSPTPEGVSPDSPTPEDLSPDSPTPEGLSRGRPTPEDLGADSPSVEELSPDSPSSLENFSPTKNKRKNKSKSHRPNILKRKS